MWGSLRTYGCFVPKIFAKGSWIGKYLCDCLVIEQSIIEIKDYFIEAIIVPKFKSFEYQGGIDYDNRSFQSRMAYYPFVRAGEQYAIIKMYHDCHHEYDDHNSDKYMEYLILPTVALESESAIAIDLSQGIDRKYPKKPIKGYQSLRLKDFPLAILNFCQIKDKQGQRDMFQALFPDKALEALPCNAPNDYFGWHMQKAISDGDLERVLAYLPESYDDEDIYSVLKCAAKHGTTNIVESMLEKLSTVSNDKLIDIMVAAVKSRFDCKECLTLLAGKITQLNETQANKFIDACVDESYTPYLEFLFENYQSLISPDKLAETLAETISEGDFKLLNFLKLRFPDFNTFMNQETFLEKVQPDEVIQSELSFKVLYEICPQHEMFVLENAKNYFKKMMQKGYVSSAIKMLEIHPSLACDALSEGKNIAHFLVGSEDALRNLKLLKNTLSPEEFENVMQQKDKEGLTPMHRLMQYKGSINFETRRGHPYFWWYNIGSCADSADSEVDQVKASFKDYSHFLLLRDANGHTPLFYYVEQVKKIRNWTPIQIHAVLNKVEGMSDIGEAIKLIQTCRSQIADMEFIITPEDKRSYHETVSAAPKSFRFPKLSERLYEFGTDMKTFRKKYNEKSGINGLFKRNSRKLMVESVGNALAKFHEHPSQENLESLQTTVVMVLQGIATEKAGRPYKSESNMESLCKEIKVECDSALAYYAQYNEEKPGPTYLEL